MDHDSFRGPAQHQHSQMSFSSIVSLPSGTIQSELRAPAPALGLGSILRDALPTSFFSSQDRLEVHHRGEFGDEGGGSSHSNSSHPLPPVPLPPLEIITPTPIESHAVHPDPRARPLSVYRTTSLGRQSRLDWIVPREESAEKAARERTVGERLDPTLLTAILEKERCAFKARLVGYAINAAIVLQVLFGTLTTGLAVVLSGHQAQVSTAVLGGFSTLIASGLARARGSNEPELSITRVKDLEQFIRECKAFKLDYGHVLGDKYDDELVRFRKRFEELLGNVNGEQKLSPPV